MKWHKLNITRLLTQSHTQLYKKQRTNVAIAIRYVRGSELKEKRATTIVRHMRARKCRVLVRKLTLTFKQEIQVADLVKLDRVLSIENELLN